MVKILALVICSSLVLLCFTAMLAMILGKLRVKKALLQNRRADSDEDDNIGPDDDISLAGCGMKSVLMLITGGFDDEE